MFKFPWTKRREARAAAELAEKNRRDEERARRLAAIRSSNHWTGQNRNSQPASTFDSFPALASLDPGPATSAPAAHRSMIGAGGTFDGGGASGSWSSSKSCASSSFSDSGSSDGGPSCGGAD